MKPDYSQGTVEIVRQSTLPRVVLDRGTAYHYGIGNPHYPVPATYRYVMAANWPDAYGQCPKLCCLFLATGGF